MALVCGEKNCRKEIKPTDFDTNYKEWDNKIKNSIMKLFEVEQPLMPFVDENTRGQLDELFRNPESYKSVYSLKYIE